MRQLYQGPFSKILLVYAMVSAFEADYGMDLWVWQPLDGPSFHLNSKLCLCSSLHGCFAPNSKKGQSIHALVFVLPELYVFRKLYLISWVFCYSAIKKNEFMKFLGKWMDLEGIILSEATQSQKNSHNMYSLISGY